MQYVSALAAAMAVAALLPVAATAAKLLHECAIPGCVVAFQACFDDDACRPAMGATLPAEPAGKLAALVDCANAQAGCAGVLTPAVDAVCSANLFAVRPSTHTCDEAGHTAVSVDVETLTASGEISWLVVQGSVVGDIAVGASHFDKAKAVGCPGGDVCSGCAITNEAHGDKFAITYTGGDDNNVGGTSVVVTRLDGDS